MHDFGIKIVPTQSTPSVNNITIENINFSTFKQSGIKVRGWAGSNPQKCSPVTIKNCKITNTHMQGIIIQRCDNVTIEDCHIEQTHHVAGFENDGIFLNESCDNTIINDNYVSVTNNIADANIHVDGIQIAGGDPLFSTNATISNNVVINESSINVDSWRDGIIVSGVIGTLKILNNNIYSAKGANLIADEFYSSTNAVLIYNNTLYSDDDPGNLLYLNKVNGSAGVLRIKNNIFYKKGTYQSDNSVAVKFNNMIYSDINADILNYNLYVNSNNIPFPGTTFVTLEFYNNFVSNKRPWNFYTNCLGLEKLPLFVSNGREYYLQLHSPAINFGVPLNEVTTDRNGKKRPYWSKGIDLGAYELPEAQLRIGVTGVGSTERITHSIEAIGTSWIKDGNSWPISSLPQVLNNSFRTVGNTSEDKDVWSGFYFDWMREGNESAMGHCLYKISNTRNPGYYFYLDLRDAITLYNPNLFLMYNSSEGINKYQYYKNGTFVGNDIANGSIKRIWEIANNGTPQNTSGPNGLTNYWDHVLVCVNLNDHPSLIFGPHTTPPVSVYKIQKYDLERGWADYGDPDILTSYFYQDQNESYLNGNNGTHQVQYRIWGHVVPPPPPMTVFQMS